MYLSNLKGDPWGEDKWLETTLTTYQKKRACAEQMGITQKSTQQDHTLQDVATQGHAQQDQTQQNCTQQN
jgi:hypothetical protein